MWDSGVVEHVVVTAPAERVPEFQEVIAAAGLRATVVPGGATRQASVAAGLDAANAADYVLIHDAARALTPPELIRQIVAALDAGHPAVVPALPVVDTIKRVGHAHADGTEPVLETIDRAPLRAMTPLLNPLLEAPVRRAFTVAAGPIRDRQRPKPSVPGNGAVQPCCASGGL